MNYKSLIAIIAFLAISTLISFPVIAETSTTNQHGTVGDPNRREGDERVTFTPPKNPSPKTNSAGGSRIGK